MAASLKEDRPAAWVNAIALLVWLLTDANPHRTPAAF